MKKSIITFTLLLAAVIVYAQEKPYNPNADAKADIKSAIAKAKAENKHVLVQVGGNWCSWCLKFHKMASTEPKIDSLIKADYVYILLNYSKENKNLDILKTYQNPQRFGFPVFLVIDGSGKLLHTQDSGFLELDKGYDPKKVTIFLKQWNFKALDPKNYPDK